MIDSAGLSDLLHRSFIDDRDKILLENSLTYFFALLFSRRSKILINIFVLVCIIWCRQTYLLVELFWNFFLNRNF